LSAAQLNEKDMSSLQLLMDGQVQLVFGSPEKFLSGSRWREMLLSPVYQANVMGLAVDEAHLVEKW
jgi:ATP-dependent DNA helicase RecQ